MKVDLQTKRLYTDDGKYLKTISCPKKMKLSNLKPEKDGHYSCSACAETIIDTAGLRDEELTQILRKNPRQCLKIDLDQDNLHFL